MKTSKTHLKSSIISSLGVFFLFSTLGFAVDVMKMGRQPVLRLWLSVVVFGGFAICYATAGYVFRRKWRKAVVVMLSILIVENLSMNLLFRLIPESPAPSQMQASDIAHMHTRLNGSAEASIIAMVLAYMCFLYVTITEGRRQVRIQTEIELAAQVHRALVPEVKTSSHNFEFYGQSLPSGEVGGDLIDVFQDDDGWIAYVADVSGHGVAPGVVMAMVKSATRMRLSSNEKSHGLLESLNSVLYSVTRPETFVTFAYLASNGAQLEYSTAAHPSILHYHGITKECSEIACSNLPLGMFEGQTFTNGGVDCGPGDLFLLVTDGLLEVEDANGQEFGLVGLKAVLARHATEPLGAIFQSLLGAARRHGRTSDDQTLLLVRCPSKENCSQSNFVRGA
jgi:hypothetical protein